MGAGLEQKDESGSEGDYPHSREGVAPGEICDEADGFDSNRNIVQVFNEDETQLQATILAIPNYRLERTGDTELRYWESASGTPPALRAWFYPGDNYGQEFAYPKEVAEQIAARNKAKVSWYEGAGDPDSLKMPPFMAVRNPKAL